jgi:deoxyribodipyrimidine photo-lyase
MIGKAGSPLEQPKTQSGRSIYWARNDLRLHDNATLRAFCEQSTAGLVVWCPSASFHRAGPWRKTFILLTLDEFAEQIRAKGGEIIVSPSSARETIPKLVRDQGVDQIFVTTEPTPEENAEEEDLIRDGGAPLIRVKQSSLLHPDDLPFEVSSTPEVFTQFRKIVEGISPIRETFSEPKHLPQVWAGGEELTQKSLPIDRDLGFIHPKIRSGEAAGLARVHEYIWEADRLRVYKDTRNGMIDWNDSSKFSPWLSVGALSPRQIYSEVSRYECERERNDSTYWMTFELLWRDYFRFICEKKKTKVFGKKAPLTDIQARDLARWMGAETGDDLIDANMIELNQTGWMSNRGRQNVASFLAKEMGVPWQYGAEYFESQLIDYDASSNWGNWAYLAGQGQDPRNRRFNTSRQSELYDPGYVYRKYWLERRKDHK